MVDREEILVARVRLDINSYSQEQAAADRRVLSEAELKRADSFRLEDLRREYVGAHAALRIVLGKRLGIAPSEVRFQDDLHEQGRGSRKKPALVEPPHLDSVSDVAERRRGDIRFNLSHTHEAALIGVAWGREIGIDIERHRQMEGIDSLAEAVMSASELATWNGLPAQDQLAAFYHLWTRKESYLKAISLGLFRDLQRVRVPVTSHRMAMNSPEAYETAAVWDELGNGRWTVTDLPAQDGYSASICFEGEGHPPIHLEDIDMAKLGSRA